MIHLNKNSLTLSWRRALSFRHQSIDIETSPLICGENQWTGFYMITASIMKRLNSFRKDRFREFVVCNLIIRYLAFRYICTASGTRGYSKNFVLSKIYKIYFRLFMEAVNHYKRFYPKSIYNLICMRADQVLLFSMSSYTHFRPIFFLYSLKGAIK